MRLSTHVVLAITAALLLATTVTDVDARPAPLNFFSSLFTQAKAAFQSKSNSGVTTNVINLAMRNNRNDNECAKKWVQAANTFCSKNKNAGDCAMILQGYAGAYSTLHKQVHGRKCQGVGPMPGSTGYQSSGAAAPSPYPPTSQTQYRAPTASPQYQSVGQSPYSSQTPYQAPTASPQYQSVGQSPYSSQTPYQAPTASPQYQYSGQSPYSGQTQYQPAGQPPYQPGQTPYPGQTSPQTSAGYVPPTGYPPQQAFGTVI